MAFVALEGWREIGIRFLDGPIRKSGSLSSLFTPARSGLGDFLMPVGSLQQAAGVSLSGGWHQQLSRVRLEEWFAWLMLGEGSF